jgi:exonuclease III
MTPFFRSAPQPFGAGRGLHLTFDLPDGALHIIALYGVSAASSTPQKISYALDVSSELRIRLLNLTGQRVICIGDFNAVWRACDRIKKNMKTYDKASYALVNVFIEFRFLDAPAQTFGDNFVPSYFHQNIGDSRIDSIWLSPKIHLHNKDTLAGALKKPGPFAI